MDPRKQGFLLLSSRLGDPGRRPLTTAQLRTLGQRMAGMKKPVEDRELTAKDLTALGYSREMAEHIADLLGEQELLKAYLRGARRRECEPLTRLDPGYPVLLRRRLGLEAPGTLWCKGDLSLLNTPAIALVGSRELNPKNREFARAVGRLAAKQGLTLISGNARGADWEAQDACLEAGGRVIAVVADALQEHMPRANMLCVSENAYDEDFTPQRALSRNRCIHTMGQMVFVAQATLEKGGTWDGTVKNLCHGWSPVICFRDGSDGTRELEQRGAYGISMEELGEFSLEPELNLFDR